MAFVQVVSGNLIHAQDLNQVINALNGLAAAGQPVALVALNDTTNYALAVRNLDTTNQRALLVQNAAGTQMLVVDTNGVTLGTPVNLQPQSVNGVALENGTVPNAALGPDVARANLLTNGGFEIWQRGNGPFNAHGAFTCDRWQNLGPITVTRETTTVDSGSTSSAHLVATAGSQYLGQPIEGPGQYSTRILTWSARVWASTPNAVRLNLQTNGTGNNVGSYHPGDSAWHTLSVTVTMPASVTGLVAYVEFDAATTAYVDNACLVVGTQPANYVPLHPADDLARCLRYYEFIGSIGTLWGNTYYNYVHEFSTTQANMIWSFKTIKATTPTFTIQNLGSWTILQPAGGGLQPLTASAPQAQTQWGSVCQFTVAGNLQAGAIGMLNSGSNGAMIAEANP